MSWICFICWVLSLDWIQPAVVCLWGASQHWILITEAAVVPQGVWSVMSKMQLLWGPQTTDWALNSYMLQSLSVCEQSCCFCFSSLHEFIRKPQLRWPFQQWKKMKKELVKFFMQSDVYICFECVRQFFHSYSHMRKTISSSFCPQIHRDKDALCSSVSQKRHSLSTGKITRPWPDTMLSVM